MTASSINLYAKATATSPAARRMRILHVIRVPRYSGVEMMVRDIAAIHVAEGHAVCVCALGPAEPDFLQQTEVSQQNGVIWRCPAQRLSRPQRMVHIRKVVREFSPDVVVAHTVLPAGYARLALPFARPAVVSVLQDASEDDYGKLPVLRWLERFLRHRTDAIIAVSPTAIRNYTRRIGGSAPKHLIRNGLKIEVFKAAERRREEIRRQLGFDADARVVLQVGRIAPVKRQHLTMAAMARVHRLVPGLQLLFAGIEEDQPYIASLRQTCSEHCADEWVRFLGPRSDIPELMAAADVYVMPSSGEAHSVAMLESLACGVSVVASDIDPFRFAAAYPGVNLVDPCDAEAYSSAVERPLANRQRWSRDLAEFSVQKSAAAYLRVFNEVAA